MTSNSRRIANLLEQTSGRFFSVTFEKKDGSIRTINGRTGVVKGLTGGKSTVDTNKYLIVYENATDGYRCVNKDRIIEASLDGMLVVNKSIL